VLKRYGRWAPKHARRLAVRQLDAFCLADEHRRLAMLKAI
jgi:hypothetical protein